MRRAIKIRIYPDREQLDFLHRQFSAVRFVWNQELVIKQHRHKMHGDKLSATDDLQPLFAAAKRNTRCVLRDRDVNAALNIKRLGILELRAGGWPVPVCAGLRKPGDMLMAACEQAADRRKPVRSPGKFE